MFSSVCKFLGNPAPLFLLLCALPVLAGFIAWLFRSKRHGALQMATVLVFGAANLFLALSLYAGGGASGSLSFLGEEFDLSMIVSGVSALMLLLTAFVFLGVSAASCAWFRTREQGGLFLLYLFISLGMVNGALISDHLGVLLFFWEGLLGTLSGFMLLKNREKPATALKALAVSATADLLLMLGIVTTVHVAGTSYMSEIHLLSTEGLGGVGLVLMLLGAMGKLGAYPFHSWIPDAADDAPTPFLAAFPGSLQKILGAYLSIRVVNGLYAVTPGSGMRLFILIMGGITLLCGSFMALAQKDIKRMLAYHTVGVSGLILMSIGSGYAAGLVGGIFLLISHVIAQSGLFIAAGAIEDRTGSTELAKISGLSKLMPVTAVCFIVLSLCSVGLPGLAGFPAGMLALGAAKSGGIVFYLIGLLGIFLAAVAFFKMIRSAFFGPLHLPKGHLSVSEARSGMLVPAALSVLACIFFGVYSAFPVDRLIQPSLGLFEELSGYTLTITLFVLPLLMLALALVDHILGAKKGGAPQATAHMEGLPILKQCYALAQGGKLDPYNWMMAAFSGFADACQWIENGVSWFYDKGIPGFVTGIATALHRYWNGSISRYLIIALAGVAGILVIFLAVML